MNRLLPSSSPSEPPSLPLSFSLEFLVSCVFSSQITTQTESFNLKRSNTRLDDASGRRKSWRQKKRAQTLAGYLARCTRFSDIKPKILDVNLTERVVRYLIFYLLFKKTKESAENLTDNAHTSQEITGLLGGVVIC